MKNKKLTVLFVYPDIVEYALFKGTFYTGIASIAAVLKQLPFCDVSLAHITQPIKKEELISLIEASQPGIVAFSSTTNMYPYVSIWAQWVKEEFSGIITVCGGVHPTICADDVVGNPAIDVVCVGEGEKPMVDLCTKVFHGDDYTSVGGMWVKSDGRIVKNGQRPLINNLDDLPFPDRDIFDYQHLHSESEGRATVMLSRGCPYSCTYCCNETLRKGASESGGKYVRFRSVKSAIEELEMIKEHYPFITRIAFDDDILPLNRSWFFEFAKQYKEKINLPYDCNIRPNLVNDSIVEALRESGCYQVRLGIESGNDYIRSQVLKRNLSDEQITMAIRLCKGVGIKVHSFNMIGLPYETLEMMLETIKLNAKLKTDVNQVTIFYPYKGTPLYDVCERERLLNTDKQVLDYSRDTMLVFDTVKRNQILFIQQYFRFLVKWYALLAKMSPRVGNGIRVIFEKCTFNKVSSFIILPIITKITHFILNNRVLCSWARMFYRKILK